MALTLITGLPGHGKTLYALQWVQNQALADGRAVFFHGIKDLKLPWQPWNPEEWQELEPGSILVIDECQSVFPVRGRGQPAAWIEEIAKHRHKGIDFVLITQNPMLMDSFVRRLVDRHFHVVRKFGTHFATIHEYVNGVKENVAASREGSITHEWRYPKDVFDWYKSAELHTVKRRIPARVWVLGAVPFVFVAIALVAWNRLDPRNSAGAPQDPAPASGLPLAGPGPGRASDSPPRDYVAENQPRVPGLAYTAPAFDEVTKPVRAPFPAACVQSKSRCQCYTDQGTRVETTRSICESIVAGGFFVSWDAGVRSGPVYAPAPAPVAVPPAAPPSL